MKSRLKVYVPLLLINFVFVTALSGVVYAQGEYNYLSDQLSREHRDGADVDEWIERGTATITASPRFENGTRLTAWASKHEGDDSYEFAIASAVYFFEIPSQAQYIEILVRYRGEPSESYFEDAEPIAGRVWIRNLQREATRRYDDKSAEETRYGDTFVLRAKRRSETIKLAAAGHVDADGLLEMHVVAEDGQQIDIEYINVSTYRKTHHISVFPRYARHYHWRPWHRYTYSYFYDGPFYYGTDLGYYFRWTYPVYDRSYLSIRSAYGDYVHRYYTIHHRPYYYYRSYPSHVHVYVNKRPARSTRLNRWSAEHETARRAYTRSRLSTTVRANNQGNARSRVNAVINQHRQEQSALAEQRQSSTGVRSRDRSNTNTRLNTTGNQRSRSASTPRRSFTQPNRSSQPTFQRRRYQPYSRSNASEYSRSARTNRTPTSNAERRQRLSERSRSSYSRQYRAPSSNSRYDSSPRTSRQRSTSSSANRGRSSVSRQRTSTSSRTSSSTRSRPSPTVRQRSSSSSSRSSSSSSRSSSSSTSKDDDEEKNSRSRQTQRSRSRRR